MELNADKMGGEQQKGEKLKLDVTVCYEPTRGGRDDKY